MVEGNSDITINDDEKRSLCRSVAETFLQGKPRSRFTFSDIDTDSVSFYERLDAEVNSIYNSPRARKGRNIFSIRDSSFRGLVAEAWYIQNQRFPGTISWTDKRWHDILIAESKYEPFTGMHIEIKTLSEWSLHEVFRKIDATIWAVWNASSFISMFLTNWDQERDAWFNNTKKLGKSGTFVDHVESGKSNVWWDYFGTKCIDPTKKILRKENYVDI